MWLDDICLQMHPAVSTQPTKLRTKDTLDGLQRPSLGLQESSNAYLVLQLHE